MTNKNSGNAPHIPLKERFSGSTGALEPPPPAAVGFRLFRLERITGRKSGNAKWAATKVMGETADDGTVEEVFPIAKSDPRFVVATWGPGRYRYDWCDEGRKKIASQTIELRTPASEVRKARAREHAPLRRAPAAAGSYVAADSPEAGALGLSPLELFDRLEARSQREAERIRADAERASERDRSFMSMMVQQIGAGKGAGAPSEASAELLKREMQLTIREQMIGIREDVAKELAAVRAAAEAAAASAGGGDDDVDPNYKPPKNVSEASSRVLIRLIEELEEASPELVKGIIPGILAKMKTSGIVPTTALERAAARKLNGKAEPVPSTIGDESPEELARLAAEAAGETH